MGINRSPVREAFRVLEREPLIATLTGKSSFITEITQDLKELFDFRDVFF